MPWCSQMGEPLGLAEVAGARRIRYREEGEAKEEGERARAWSFSGRELRDQLRFSYNLIPKACAVVMILSHGSQLFFFDLRMTASSSLQLSLCTGTGRKEK